MLRDTSLKIAKITTKIPVGETKMLKVCPVNFSTKVHVLIIVLMKLEAFFADTFVPRILQGMAKLFLIQR